MTSFLSAAGLRLLAVFLITAMSAIIHALGDGIELGQIIFWRSAVALIPILAYMAWRDGLSAGLQTARPWLHVTRGVLGVATMALVIYLPVATAQAFGFLTPVLTLPLAAILLHERIGLPLLLAVLLGFGGVLLILMQALEVPDDGALIGIAAGFGYALMMSVLRIYVKSMTRSERPALIAFSFAITGALVGLATAIWGWSIPDTGQLILLCSAGLLGGFAHIASTEAVARAPVSAVAPFDFTGLIWAAGFDLLLFGYVPGLPAIAGMVAITAAALIVTLAGERGTAGTAATARSAG